MSGWLFLLEGSKRTLVRPPSLAGERKIPALGTFVLAQGLGFLSWKQGLAQSDTPRVELCVAKMSASGKQWGTEAASERRAWCPSEWHKTSIIRY